MAMAQNSGTHSVGPLGPQWLELNVFLWSRDEVANAIWSLPQIPDAPIETLIQG